MAHSTVGNFSRLKTKRKYLIKQRFLTMEKLSSYQDSWVPGLRSVSTSSSPSPAHSLGTSNCAQHNPLYCHPRKMLWKRSDKNLSMCSDRKEEEWGDSVPVTSMLRLSDQGQVKLQRLGLRVQLMTSTQLTSTQSTHPWFLHELSNSFLPSPAVNAHKMKFIYKR